MSENSSPHELGTAIIQHWNEKIISSKIAQSVKNSYESILLKTIKGDEYMYCEFPLQPLDPNVFSWDWTVEKHTGKIGAGLQGRILDKLELVWYKNQKQLFRTRTFPEQAVTICIERTRLTPERYVKSIILALQKQLSHSSLVDELEE